MFRFLRLTFALVGLVLLAQQATSQESKAAKSTREKLKQVIAEFEAKDVGTKAFFEDVNREVEKTIRFTIDGTTGISNNTKLTFKAKKVTVEKLLNDLSDKYEFGWFVLSNEGNNKTDGSVIIRKTDKGKERGYEAGKAPKKDKTSRQSSPQLPREPAALTQFLRSPEAIFVRTDDRYLRD
jgi:hypothetical protein